jgi:hypothetical protein
MSVIFNLSDGNATGWFRYAIQPFSYVLGGVDMFCTFLILLISGLTYIGSDHNTFTTSLVLLISSLIFSTVLVSVMSMFIAVIAGLIVTFLLYKTFVERKVNQ